MLALHQTRQTEMLDHYTYRTLSGAETDPRARNAPPIRSVLTSDNVLLNFVGAR